MTAESENDDLSLADFEIHLLSGVAAGIAENCAVYPLDSIKTKMQTMNPTARQLYRNMISATKTIWRTNGLLSTFRGISVVALGAGPAHALYFATYEMSKQVMGKKTSLSGTHPVVAGTSAMLATLAHDAFMNPVDVTKQRLQMHNSPYSGAIDCVRRTLQKEGIRAFYRSYSTQLVTNIPFQFIHFYTYENVKAFLSPDGVYDPVTNAEAGGIAGGLAAALTTPLDAIKTVLNTQEAAVVQSKQSYTNSISDAGKAIYHLYGVKGFTRGLLPRVLQQAPSTAISWLVYEFMKHTLFKGRHVTGRAGVVGNGGGAQDLENLPQYTPNSALVVP